MARLRLTMLQVEQRLNNPARWTMEERRAAIKALQGTVNRAYDRLTKTYNIDNFATKAVRKSGKIKTWTELKNLSYREQMAEIRRGADLAGMRTLSKSGYDSYLSETADRLNKGSGFGNFGKIYDRLSQQEQTAFWDLYHDVTASADFLASIYRSMDSERIQRYVYSRWAKGMTADDLKKIFNMSNDRQAAPTPPDGITFDPMDLT